MYLDQREVYVTAYDSNGKPLTVDIDGCPGSYVEGLIAVGKIVMETQLGKPGKKEWKRIRRKKKPLILGEITN